MYEPPKTLLRYAAPLAALLVAGAVPAGPHGSGEPDGRGHDHERARHALSRGEVRPIAEILAEVARRVPGEVVEVELERSGGHGRRGWLYELKIIAPDGHLLEVLVDAATGRILEVEED